MTTDFPTAPGAYGLNGPSAPVPVEKSPLASHTEILTSPNFKVPTLRNVELTYPYFHDGAAKTLKDAVDTMGRLQLGKKFTDEENARIVAFLKTLTGEQPKFTIPLLPPSADATPRPQPFQ